MNPNNNEDDLEQVNRLLERLHQAGYDHHCSQFTLVYVASGAQHVDRIDTQNIKALPDPPRKRENPLAGELPKELHTDEAMALWQKAQQAGYVDEHYQPKISRTQAALLADAMAHRLGIKEKWKVFEEFWHRNYMRSDYNLALSQQQSYDFQDELKQLFG